MSAAQENTVTDAQTQFEDWYVQNAFDYAANPIGSRDCGLMRRAWHAALAARQPGAQEPITVEAVATIERDSDGDRYVSFLLEGGISELEVGDVLMVADRSITDDDGSGEVYAAPPAQSVDLIPAGWTIAQGEELRIVGPTEGPGGLVMDKPGRSLESRLLYALATALIDGQRDAATGVGIELGSGVKAIAAERERQMEAEGFTRDVDQQYRHGELAKAATAYVQLAAMDLEAGTRDHIAWHGPAAVWPWAPEWWKPVDARRDLVRAGALIAAQIDLIDQRDSAPGVDRG